MASSLFYVVLVVLVVVSINFVRALNKLQEHYSWQVLDYAYRSQLERNTALSNGDFIPENNLPVGMEVWRDKVFVTVPRWRPGIPSTLNVVPLVAEPQNSLPLIPYPGWQWTKSDRCETSLTTVYRIKADQCDRLWVLDTGTIGIGNTTTNPCPYALNVFDLHTNRRIRRYVLRQEDINERTFIANIAVDGSDGCDHTYAYMSDELGYGLIVYSWAENRSWRFTHNFFQPDPLAGNFHIAGLNFQWGEEGIFGLSLTPSGRHLLFSPLASGMEFVVATQTLKNPANVDDAYYHFQLIGYRGSDSHVTAKVIDHERGVQFFNLIDRNAIGCWNIRNPFESDFIAEIARDDERLIFPSDAKIDSYGNLWIMSDRMSTFLNANLTYSETNFRIFFAPIKSLIENTVCQ